MVHIKTDVVNLVEEFKKVSIVEKNMYCKMERRYQNLILMQFLKKFGPSVFNLCIYGVMMHF